MVRKLLRKSDHDDAREKRMNSKVLSAGESETRSHVEVNLGVNPGHNEMVKACLSEFASRSGRDKAEVDPVQLGMVPVKW